MRCDCVTSHTRGHAPFYFPDRVFTRVSGASGNGRETPFREKEREKERERERTEVARTREARIVFLERWPFH